MVVAGFIGSVVMAPALSDNNNAGSIYISSTESNDDNKSNSEVSGNILSDSDNNTDTYSSNTQTYNEATGNSSSSTVNSEYEEIISRRNIVDSFAGFLLLDSASFVKVDEDGMVDKLDYG